MNTKKMAILATICVGCGFLYYAVHTQLVVVFFPKFFSARASCFLCAGERKSVTLYIHNGSKWTSESVDLVWSNVTGENVKLLVQTLLNWLADNMMITKRVNVLYVGPDYRGLELFISFDRSPLSKDMSIVRKQMILESILKTIRESGAKVPRHVRFLCNHQPMNDSHLDVSIPWPLEGFLE